MSLLFFINLFVLFCILSILFWPNKYLRIGIYIPLLLSVFFLIYDGCQIIEDLNLYSFIEELYIFFFPHAVMDDVKRRSSNITIFILLLITNTGYARLLYST
jgi:hypothetical protein